MARMDEVSGIRYPLVLSLLHALENWKRILVLGSGVPGRLVLVESSSLLSRQDLSPMVKVLIEYWVRYGLAYF